jgi:hypothetical protein
LFVFFAEGEAGAAASAGGHGGRVEEGCCVAAVEDLMESLYGCF